MDTGEYTDNFIQLALVSVFFPAILLAYGNIGSGILAASKEDNEDKIQVILKQIGIRATVNIC